MSADERTLGERVATFIAETHDEDILPMDYPRRLLREQQAEIERLTRCIEIYEETNDRVGTEIEQLRALLREAFDGLDDYWIKTPEGASWVLRVSDGLGNETKPVP